MDKKSYFIVKKKSRIVFVVHFAAQSLFKQWVLVTNLLLLVVVPSFLRVVGCII